MVVDQGFVPTDIGNRAANLLGMDQAPGSVDDTCDGLVLLIDSATKETHGGRYWEYTGKELPW